MKPLPRFKPETFKVLYTLYGPELTFEARQFDKCTWLKPELDISLIMDLEEAMFNKITWIEEEEIQ